MKKFWVLALAVFLCRGAAPAASSFGLDCFPASVGTAWTYDTKSKNGKERFPMRVTIDPSEKLKEGLAVVMTQKDRRGRMRSFLLVDESGVRLVKTGVSKAFTPEIDAWQRPPMPWMLFPLEPGQKFRWEGILKVAWVDKKIVLDGEVVGEEDVTVPAGTFRCIRIHYHQLRGDEVVDEDVWYARGVGQVKYSGGTYIKELSSFSVK